MPLARWGDWLVMAATLALLRSRLLLPAGSPEALDAAEEADGAARSTARPGADRRSRRLAGGASAARP